MSKRNRRPSPALIVAVLALVAGVTGTASALPGTKTVAKNDLKRDSVVGSKIAKDAVKSSDIKDGKVQERDLADPEPFHRVGVAGEPPLSNGGEGDCVWGPSTIPVAGTNPVSYYRDPFGVVHLAGATSPTDGAGGDGQCDPTAPGEAEDAIIFVLPPQYRPENVQFVGASLFTALIVPDEGAVIDGQSVEAGAVLSLLGGGALLDGSTFRAAGEATAPIEARAGAELGSLKELRAAMR